MRSFALSIALLMSCSMGFPGGSAATSQAVVNVLTDTGHAWASGPVTVDDATTQVRAVQTPGAFKIEFDGPVDLITATLTGSAATCGLEIDENGQNTVSLTCSYASRLWYVENCDSVVVVPGVSMTITPCSLGGYGEIHNLDQTNAHVQFSHEVRKSGGPLRDVSTTCYPVLYGIAACNFADVGPQTIQVSCPDTVWAWTHVSTPDGFARSDLDAFPC